MRVVLERLASQDEPAEQVLVIDASSDNLTRDTVSDFNGVRYVRNPGGAGRMTHSRNAALELASGDIIAFLDDDAFPDRDYVMRLRQAYADPVVGLACSRTLNGRPGEELADPTEIGRLCDDGRLTANFACATDSDVTIDHGIGATMSFRRNTLRDLGGFREDYRGISGLREDTDAFLRARALGYRAVFISRAVAHHVGAPQVLGRRFDLRYEYWSYRNHVLLLLNNFGLRSPLLPRFLRASIAERAADVSRSVPRRTLRLAAAMTGAAHGLMLIVVRRRGRALSPRRDDPGAAVLRARLNLAPPGQA